VIEEIEEMMQNSPDPEEELDEDDNDLEEISTHSDSILLQEMQALSKTFNNNWTAEDFLSYFRILEFTNLRILIITNDPEKKNPNETKTNTFFGCAHVYLFAWSCMTFDSYGTPAIT
ncbi:hypothetical protein AB205_0140070, partial [Aquarana catesbeiana]